MDQIFAFKAIPRNYLNRERTCSLLLWTKRNLMIRQIEELCGGYRVQGRLMEAVACLNESSKSCVRMGREESKMFIVQVDLRKECII